MNLEGPGKYTLLFCPKIQQPSLSLPLTERSARVLPKVPFELAQTSSYSASRDSSASYRTARTSVNPSSRYGKLDPLRVVRTVANTDSLAQASLTRPGEMCGGSPRVSCASGPPGDQSGGGLALAGLSRLSEIPQPWRGAGRNSVVFLDVCCSWMLGDEQLRFEQRYPPQVQAFAESDQVIRIRMSRVESYLPVSLHGCVVCGCSSLRSTWLMGADGRGSRGHQGNDDSAT
ncbi:hypothetical protein DEO72_LG5g1528 [Vigna unguiculata]|uniref:Uncharacterized protein n=1 Tax=Vigna unguiculata TaxID=3917 RepID=A0A4D6LY84_VIGUN|nr:hypothetical protein DEO72_LG5g1527 [Vigna unguiculata]QCD93453.1 hypothetical protein DEO72_LG5g1528 [Vigna unguiculata]